MIIKQFGGDIFVYSRKGSGSIFTFFMELQDEIGDVNRTQQTLQEI